MGHKHIFPIPIKVFESIPALPRNSTSKEDIGKGHNLLPSFLLEDRWGVAMTTLPHFPGEEWERPWLPSTFLLEVV